MLSDFKCPYCASRESTLISNFYSAVLNAKTTVYQCGQCLNLFDFPRVVKKSELQERLNDLQQDAEERTAVARATNAIGRLSNPELGATISQIQHKSLTAQVSLIRQQVVTVNPANSELLDELRRQEFDTQVKLIEVQKQELQRRLSDLQEDVEERISIDSRGESQTLVVIYGCDNLGNHVPIDSFWTNPNNFRLPNSEPRTLVYVADLTPLVFSPVSHLLRLFFGLLQIIFGLWLLFLAFCL